MRASRRLVTVVLISVAILLMTQAPAFAPWRRAAEVSINVVQACPESVTFEAVRFESDTPPPSPDPVLPITVQGYTPPPDLANLPPLAGTRVLNQPENLAFVPNGIQVPLGEGPPEPTWWYYGKFTRPWAGGRTLAPGTEVTIGPDTLFDPVQGNPPASFAPFTTTVSDTCKPAKAKLDLKPVCAKATKTHLTWRVDNPGSTEVTFTWKLVDSRQSGRAVAPAKGSVEFTTRKIKGPDVVRIFVDGKKVDSERARCKC